MKSFNVFEDASFKYDDEDPEGYKCGYHRFGPELDGSRLGATVYEIPPGQSLCPYHWETEEEWLLVLSGEVVLRHHEGEDTLPAGTVVAFADNATGAHKVTNRSEKTARMMMWSTKDRAGFCMYPDTGKIMVFQESAGSKLHQLGPEVEYYEGEA